MSGKTYIKSASCISVQDTFVEVKTAKTFVPATFPASIVEPDYKNFVNPALLRRMSPLVRNGVTAAIDCLRKAGVNCPQAIVTGTALGCLQDTQKFMDAIVRADSETLSPTAFIQSTHNTLSGQIALQTKCHGYNMTYAQNGLSFEYALQDGLWLAEDGANDILVVGADEKIELLAEMARNLDVPAREADKLSEGAACFLLSGKKENALAILTAVHCATASRQSTNDMVQNFLAENNVPETQIDCLLYADNKFQENDSAALDWKMEKINYAGYCGRYATNSAFGLFLGIEMLQEKIELPVLEPKRFQTILILNNYFDTSLGLILIQKP